MAFYKYTVKNEYGESISGKVEAQTKEQAAATLRNRSLLVISLQQLDENSLSFLKALSGLKQDDIVNFTRQLSTMITAGLTLTESLTILKQQSKTAMAKLISDLQQEIESGTSFAKALESQGKTFSPVYIQLVRAGEAAGVLDQVLARLADTLEKDKEFRSKTKGALIYPVIVIIAMVVVAAIMMIFVVPKLTAMYSDLGAELPLPTQILIDVSGFMAKFWWLLLILIAVGSVSFRAWIKTKPGRKRFDQFLLKVPIMGVIRQKVLLTEFARTMGLLLGAGISLLQALEIVAKTMDNVVYRDALLESATQVEKGVPLSHSLTKYPQFPPLLSQMIGVGEETGKMDEVLAKLSLYFESESEHAVKDLTTAFEPLIMVVLGIGVGALVIAIILPIYNLTSSFS
jgi:type IV pilus assembly protein PilC